MNILGTILWVVWSGLLLETEAARGTRSTQSSTSHTVFFVGMVVGSIVFIVALLGFMLLTSRSRPVLESLNETLSYSRQNFDASRKAKHRLVSITDSQGVTIGTQTSQEIKVQEQSEPCGISHSAMGFVNPVCQKPPDSSVVRRRQQSNEDVLAGQHTSPLVVDVRNQYAVDRTDSCSSTGSFIDRFQRSLSSLNTVVQNPFANPLFKTDSQVISPSRTPPLRKKIKSNKRVSFKLDAASPPSV